MEISILVESELTSTNIVDNTPQYDPALQITHSHDDEYQNTEGTDIYKRTGDTVYPVTYNSGDEGDYDINTIVFKDSLIHKVVDLNPSVEPKQPEDYSVIDNGFDYNSWAHRYSLLLTGRNSPAFTHTVGDTTHRLYQSGGQWKYEIRWAGDEESYFESERYEYDTSGGNHTVRYGVIYNDADDDNYDQVKWKYNGATVKNTVGVSASAPIPGETIIVGDDGIRYKVGSEHYHETTQDPDTGVNYVSIIYAISKEQSYTQPIVKTEPNVKMYYAAAEGIVEPTAYVGDTSNPNDRWLGRSFIFRNGDLYVRTQRAVQAEADTVTTPTYAPIMAIEDFPGYTKYQATDYYKPVDGKRHTYVERVGSPAQMTLTLQSKHALFDTLALAGVVATTINVVFKRPDGTVVTNIPQFAPDNSRDLNKVLPAYQTTVILYATSVIEPGGYVEITLTGNLVRIGSSVLGLSTNAGFTNLEFTNAFDDYSPTEKDQWGNVTYIEGYKANVHTGTVDLPITSYDMMNRLMTSLGGSELIINGSDIKNNREPDSLCAFSSTMMIGRMNNFKLQTHVDKIRLGEIATYTFRIEESV